MKNNTFSAVALKYPPDREAPVIQAKAKGLLAEKMISIAEENKIPVVKDTLTESILSIQEIGDCIPEETWRAVAVIFAMIKKMESEKG